MEKPFVIYLDIDGVLVSYSKLLDRDPDGKHSFIPKAVETLNAIITMFDADICVVSTCTELNQRHLQLYETFDK